MWSVETLYKLTIQALVRSDNFNLLCLEFLSGLVKEDILNIALLRARNNVQISRFLHHDIRVLCTRESKISHEDLISIGKCHKLRVLEMNPPTTMRFDHSSNLLCGILSELRYLVKLHLKSNDGVTDTVVATLANTCPLEELDVSGCHKLSDCAAASLATLPKLRALNMSHTQISDEGLTSLATGSCALSLTELIINFCVNIRGPSIKCIVEKCCNMNILGLTGCPNLSKDVDTELEYFYGEKKKQLFWTVYC